MSEQDIHSGNSMLLRLNELVRETDYEFVLELIEIFLIETPKQILMLNTALEKEDLSSLTAVAHKLKGSCLNLGAEQLGKLCLKLEELGRSGSLLPKESRIQEINTEFEIIKKLLQEFAQSCKK